MLKLKDNDLYYLRSILGNLREVRAYIGQFDRGPAIGSEVLADNIDWLDCFIEKHERANAKKAKAD